MSQCGVHLLYTVVACSCTKDNCYTMTTNAGKFLAILQMSLGTMGSLSLQ